MASTQRGNYSSDIVFKVDETGQFWENESFWQWSPENKNVYLVSKLERIS
jgi:hypothetical protein